jgi:flagella basal body P-ring formation protein FlgA
MTTSLRTFLRFAVALAVSGMGSVQAEIAQAAALPAEVAGAASATTLTREQVLTLLTRDLAAHFNLEGDLQLELLRAWAPPPRTASRWEINVLEYPSAASSSMLLRCRVFADGVAVADATFVLRAQLWRDAWVTKQPLTIGGTFEPEMLEARRVDLFRDRDALPAAVGDRSYVFARAVPAGRLLSWRDISRKPLVKKGSTVEVTAMDGLLAISMKAVAMENGAQGETVTIRNPESRKDFTAMVVGENRVQVRF